MIGRFYKSGSAASKQQQEPDPDVKNSIPAVNRIEPDGVASVAPANDASGEAGNGKAALSFVETRVNLHRYLLDKINLGMIDRLEREELADQIRPMVREYVRGLNTALNARELDELILDTTDEILGLGPIEPLLKDDTVADILINTHESVYVERFGQLEETPIRFKDEAHLLRIVNKIVSGVGRRIDESSPTVDARLADGSRVNIAIRPIAVDGPLVSIRKFAKRPYTLERLVEANAMADVMREFLALAVKSRISLIISGGTGSGKTTMLNALSSQISFRERLITIEDAAELQLQQPHVGRMETRPPNIEGRGEVKQRELVKNALRMRPDRIIIGEVRGEEAFDMLQAMNTGHEGSMTTIHANSPRDSISRLEQMIGMAGMPMTQSSIRNQISSAIRLIVQVQRLADGSRRLTSISELTGTEGDVIQIQEIYRFRKTHIDTDNKVVGEFRATGIRPRFLEELAEVGISMSADSFEPNRVL